MPEPMPDLTDHLNELLSWNGADQDSAETLDLLFLRSPELRPLAQLYADDGRTIAIIAFDSASVWDEVPGRRSITALHLQRDPARRRFTVQAELFPTVPLAERWLTGLGLPVDRLEPIEAMRRTTDAQTLRAEDRIRRSGDRYRLVFDRTLADEVWTVFEDLAPGGRPPFLAQFEARDESCPATDYQVREARFATVEEAEPWFLERKGPPTAHP